MIHATRVSHVGPSPEYVVVRQGIDEAVTGQQTARRPLDVVVEQSRRVLETYRVDAGLVEEHANNERRIAQGGYGDRQIFELVQNAADEIRDQPGGEVAVVLTETHLYCANEGAPVSPEGVDTILRMSTSRKRGGQIGRFGVGVKSVLAISDAPEFFSTADGSVFGFGFDRALSAGRIREIAPEVEHTPVLRIAQVLDVSSARRSDRVLDELLCWATTVVRLPLRPNTAERLGADLRSFPVEFPLFSPHVGTVTLDDRRGSGVRRQIDQQVIGDARTIEELRPDGSTVVHQWRVFTRSHNPSRVALASAGELHDRPEIDISWAVPARSGARGMFWSYFPTKFATTLRGILNAPWKTSEDRQAIFDGNAFNDELISAAAELIVDSLPALGDTEDPGRYIDYLPGRGREAPQFADERLTDAIWSAAASRPSLVDQDGRFRRPIELRLHPEYLREGWLRGWSGHAGRPTDWVHHSADGRERRARVKMVMHRAGCSEESSVVDWLEALVTDRSAKASAAAVRIVAGMVTARHADAEEACRARIVRTENGEMVAPARGEVFRRSGGDVFSDGLTYVDEEVVAEFGVSTALDTLGVRDADAAGRFASVVERGIADLDHASWTSFWEMARDAGPSTALDIIRAQDPPILDAIRVRTIAGRMQLARGCLLPGAVVPADGSRDTEMTVDAEFHAADLVILRGIGVLDRPVADHDPRSEPWFDGYVEYAWKKHLRGIPDGEHRPQKTTMRVDGPNPAGPLRMLRDLSPEGCAAFLATLPGQNLSGRWTVQVGRQQSTRKPIMSPLAWMGRTDGHLRTSRGLQPVTSCVGPALAEFSHLLPVADIPAQIADALHLPAALDKIPERVWTKLITEASSSADDEFAGAVYAIALTADAPWPEDVLTRCRVGDEWSSTHADPEIAVTAVRSEYDALIRERIPALLVPTPEDADKLIEAWGMLSPARVISKELRHVAEAEGQSLVELFPHLRVRHRQAIEGWSVVRCSELEEITRTPNGIRAGSLQYAIEDRALLVLRPETDEAVLEAADAALGLGLGPDGRRSVLEQRQRQQQSNRRRAVRTARSEAEKILHLIGEDSLRAGLPQGLEEADRVRTGEAPSGVRLAQLALNTHGESILRHHARDISTQDDSAPRTFNGTTAARRHVAELGLPEAFAGASVVAPPEMEEVEGPSDLPTLHDYQERVTARMVDLLLADEPGRAMLRLPTGAGKTRVAVEAVTRFVRERGRPSGPVLWIAQSEELCEQAVESWRFVWSKAGPSGRLVINRFWGGNDAAPVTEAAQLVVATDATLRSRLGNEEYGWLRNAAVVIIDEAHRALAPEYTGILEQLGIDRTRTARPLIGLTATPFRSDEEETRRLVNRFGGHRLDEGIFGDKDPYVALQEIDVLARVEHRELEGSTIRLSQTQLADIEKFRTLPSSAEEELGKDSRRNNTLIEAIGALPDGWPVLVFATSVEHAKLLAAQLNDRGVRSTSIDGYTPVGERRRKIEEYRAGRYKVITNYGVLAQGFDAPRTRAVVIARPTYSPIVYQQMIGRGLRGPRNGGADSCLILDVRDNVQNYGGALAFTEFEHLWQR